MEPMRYGPVCVPPPAPQLRHSQFLHTTVHVLVSPSPWPCLFLPGWPRATGFPPLATVSICLWLPPLLPPGYVWHFPSLCSHCCPSSWVGKGPWASPWRQGAGGGRSSSDTSGSLARLDRSTGCRAWGMTSCGRGTWGCGLVHPSQLPAGIRGSCWCLQTAGASWGCQPLCPMKLRHITAALLVPIATSWL